MRIFIIFTFSIANSTRICKLSLDQPTPLRRLRSCSKYLTKLACARALLCQEASEPYRREQTSSVRGIEY